MRDLQPEEVIEVHGAGGCGGERGDRRTDLDVAVAVKLDVNVDVRGPLNLGHLL